MINNNNNNNNNNNSPEDVEIWLGNHGGLAALGGSPVSLVRLLSRIGYSEIITTTYSKYDFR